ncbi:uncharacterized protein LOC129892745 [Solanum dulcamara]|uniref:uncharacterized protein LOC129892745 n=1 Tax=Solanum dulcamara TaxID=45834 RepID=UPI002485FC6F|nr:uncharacterized protein LOC129892745 [Solanum dulcamara]
MIERAQNGYEGYRVKDSTTREPTLMGKKQNLKGPNMVQRAVEKVKLTQQRLLAAQSQQKVYVDNRHQPLEFQVSVWVFVKVLPMKGVMRFGNKVYPVFHVSMLRKCVDPSRVYLVDDIHFTKELSYKDQPIAILDWQIRRLRTKDVASIKLQMVGWRVAGMEGVLKWV